MLTKSHQALSCVFAVSSDPKMDRLLRLGGGMPGLGQVTFTSTFIKMGLTKDLKIILF